MLLKRQTVVTQVLGRLPLVEVLTTHISSVDDLVAVAHGAKHLHTHGGLHHGRKAAGHGAELEPDIRDILALSKAEVAALRLRE